MTSDKTFEDRVIEHLNQRRKQRDDDREWFQETCRSISNARANRDGERLVRNDDGTATKTYLGEDVFMFWAKDGLAIIRPARLKQETYADKNRALDRMAELLAFAIDDAVEARNNPQRNA